MKWCPLLARILWGLGRLPGSAGSCSVPKEVKQILISNSSVTHKAHRAIRGWKELGIRCCGNGGVKTPLVCMRVCAWVCACVFVCVCAGTVVYYGTGMFAVLPAILRLAEVCARTMCASVSQHCLPRLHLLIRAKLPRRHLVPSAATQAMPCLISAYEQTERAGWARWQSRLPVWLGAWAAKPGRGIKAGPGFTE